MSFVFVYGGKDYPKNLRFRYPSKAQRSPIKLKWTKVTNGPKGTNRLSVEVFTQDS